MKNKSHLRLIFDEFEKQNNLTRSMKISRAIRRTVDSTFSNNSRGAGDRKSWSGRFVRKLFECHFKINFIKKKETMWKKWNENRCHCSGEPAIGFPGCNCHGPKANLTCPTILFELVTSKLAPDILTLNPVCLLKQGTSVEKTLPHLPFDVFVQTLRLRYIDIQNTKKNMEKPFLCQKTRIKSPEQVLLRKESRKMIAERKFVGRTPLRSPQECRNVWNGVKSWDVPVGLQDFHLLPGASEKLLRETWS